MKHTTTATTDASAEGLRGTWPTHLSRAALMLHLAGRGAGPGCLSITRSA